MIPDVDPAELDPLLLCYCTALTIGELRAACRQGRWPLPGKERSGKLCTGCLGDLLICLRRFGGAGQAPSSQVSAGTDEPGG